MYCNEKTGKRLIFPWLQVISLYWKEAPVFHRGGQWVEAQEAGVQPSCASTQRWAQHRLEH